MKYWDVAKRYPPQIVARLILDKVWRDSHHAWGRWRAKAFGTRISNEGFRAALTSEFRAEKVVAEWIRSGQGPTFFIHHSQCNNIVAAIRKHFPELEKTTIAAADRVCEHVFDLLGSGPVQLGEKIDWHVDFKTNHRYNPQAYFADIHPAAYPGGHDIKVPWELSRFQHIPWLGEAYWFTGDEKYAREFVAQVTDWIERNPSEFGVNWTTSMEAAIRLVNWFWGLAFFRGSPTLTDEFLTELAKSFLAHGRHIFRNLERHDTYTGNHYLADLVGLIFLGSLCPYFKEAENWHKFGMVELWKEMDKQVYPDGVDFEASIGYHRFVTEFFVSAVVLCQLNQLEVSGQVLERLEKMLEFVLHYTKPDGTVPLFGDFDNGRLQRLKVWGEADREWLDHRFLLALGAVIYGRDDFGQGAGDQWEEAVWMLGERALTAKEALESKSLELLKLPSRSFPVGGIYVMRHGDLYLAVEAGSNGQNGNGGHAHNDTLSFELFAGGQSWIIDPGTYAYSGDFEARNTFRSARYHNGLLVDGREPNQIDKVALFSLPDAISPEVDAWRSTSESDIFSASYISVPSTRVKRTFVLDKQQNCLLIQDEVVSPGQHVLEAYLHCAPARLKVADNVARVEQSNGTLVVKVLSGAADFLLSEAAGSLSYSYGLQVQAPVMYFKTEFTDRVTLCWLVALTRKDFEPDSQMSGHALFDKSYLQMTEWLQAITANDLRR